VKNAAFLFTRNETARLAAVPISVVDKAIGQGVVRSRRLKGMTFVSREGVLALRVLQSVQQAGMSMSIKSKKRLVVRLAEEQRRGHSDRVLELTPAVVIRPDQEALEAAARADRYAEGREQWIEHNPRILGGDPVIAGTRITAHAVARRLEDGDTIDVLLDDYPQLPREAFEVADMYARTHPRRGRPLKPWRDLATA
jgi:uncharacterized protein (DUF433 family)